MGHICLLYAACWVAEPARTREKLMAGAQYIKLRSREQPPIWGWVGGEMEWVSQVAKQALGPPALLWWWEQWRGVVKPGRRARRGP
ncbi:MAG TPA: hypothetical protein DC084_23255 [Cupriavidus sp.]|nr:hypothetical protein [Cupriavidus sp.]